MDAAIAAADMVFPSVNRLTKAKVLWAGQSSYLSWIEVSARQVAACAYGHTEKSTIPVRTAEAVQAILGAFSPQAGSNRAVPTFLVLSNPEF